VTRNFEESTKMNTENASAANPSSSSATTLDAQFLDEFEVRVLAVLAEKEATTPDNYPMSLNALVNGCNQLSSRDPIMALTESTVLEVLDRLAHKKLVSVINQAGARVMKYEHRMRIKWMLEQDKLAVLTTLMLRGFQTAGEIRSRSGRLHEFNSITEVETCLEFLMDKYPAVAAKLARTPGTKESRYAHLLSGEEVLQQQEALGSQTAAQASSPQRDRLAYLESEVVNLKEQMSMLSLQFEEFKKQFE
jgi:uncharacterized protein YceH (UPF0502 family)